MFQVQLLNMEHNPDIMLLAARAMTFMADSLPSSCGTIVRHGAIPVFCARLLTIEYIDLAEQSLQVKVLLTRKAIREDQIKAKLEFDNRKLFL
jgi:hypothetical protein